MIKFVTVWFLLAVDCSGCNSSNSYTIPYSSKASCLVAKETWESKSASNDGYCWSGEMPIYVPIKEKGDE